MTVNDDRPLSDHTFTGPGYPISHPGLFPIPLVPSRFTPQQWLKFDYRAEWGSDEFESKVAKLIAHLGHDDAGQVTHGDLIAWKEELLKSGASHKTIENYLMAVKTLFNFAMKNKKTSTDTVHSNQRARKPNSRRPK